MTSAHIRFTPIGLKKRDNLKAMGFKPVKATNEKLTLAKNGQRCTIDKWGRVIWENG